MRFTRCNDHNPLVDLHELRKACISALLQLDIHKDKTPISNYYKGQSTYRHIQAHESCVLLKRTTVRETLCCAWSYNDSDGSCSVEYLSVVFLFVRRNIHHQSSSSSSSSCGLSLNGHCCFHERPPSRRLAHGKHLSCDVSSGIPCQANAGKLGGLNQKNSLESALGRPETLLPQYSPNKIVCILEKR